MAVNFFLSQFPSETLIYPTALTATGGHAAEMLIYLAAQHKMDCNGRFRLLFAGSLPENTFEILQTETEPPGFFSSGDLTLKYLCKFKDTLSSSQMQDDIFFEPAPNDEPYREHSVSW